jgi:tRNA (cmo5U34)-methyltransferase
LVWLMGAASHLGIDLREYDVRIRTFIPGYERLLEIAARALANIVRARSPLVVDLGIGTGALAARSVAAKPSIRIVGVDKDEEMLAAARTRLGRRLTGLRGNFETADLPTCDAVTASLALHHIPTAARRLRLFRRIHRALRPGGLLVIADCYLASDRQLQADDRREWLTHLQRTYTARESRAYLRAWAKEDFYARLTDELRLLELAGFAVDVPWRLGSFAVIASTTLAETGNQRRRHRRSRR